MVTPIIGTAGASTGSPSRYTVEEIAKAWDALRDNSRSAKDPDAYSFAWNKLAPEDQQALYQKLASNPYQMFMATPKLQQDSVDFFTGQSRFAPQTTTVTFNDGLFFGDNGQVLDPNSVVRDPNGNYYTSTNPTVSLLAAASAYGDNYMGAPQVSILQSLAPEIAAKYGITPEYAQSALTNLLYRNSKTNSAEWQGMDKEAALMAATVLTAGAAGGAFRGAGAAAGEGAAAAAAGEGAAAADAGYTGSLVESAAGGLGVPEAGYYGASAFGGADAVAAAGAGSTAYYDAGAGMWVDSATGEGIASGASVPEGYSAGSADIANAAANTAPTTSAGSWSQSLDNAASKFGDWLKQGNNAKSLAGALQAFTSSPTASNGQAMSSFPSSISSGVSPQSGAVNSSNGGSSYNQSMLLENPTSSMIQESAPVQQQAQPLGMIDVSPATNTFLQAGSTWNQQMANALRNRNAY